MQVLLQDRLSASFEYTLHLQAEESINFSYTVICDAINFWAFLGCILHN